MKNDKEGSIKLVTSLAIMVLLIVLVGILGFKILNYKQEYTNEKCYVCADTKLINHEMKFTSTKLQQKETISNSLAFHKTMEESMREEAMKNHIEAVRIEHEKRHKEELEKERLRRLEERKKAEAAKKKVQEQARTVSRGSGYKVDYEITHYTAFCPTGCTGKTYSGHDVSNTIYYQGLRIVAAPPNVKLYTKLRITYSNGNSIDAIVLDRGGAIRGKPILDLLVSSREEAYKLGRQQVKVEVIK